MGTLDLKDKVILVTGAAGFIGGALCERLLKQESATVIGIDNMNDSYAVSLKDHRLDKLKKFSSFTFLKGDILNRDFLDSVFEKYRPNVIVHLAAQAGIRNSVTHPESCIESNIFGFFNVLEKCRAYPVSHFIYASSSSVYGDNGTGPYTTDARTDTPASLYAATKKNDELMTYAYSRLYRIPCTGLRLFTVYGQEGRPDMAYFSFVDKLLSGQKIQLFNYGKCERDFTYIDDVVEGVIRVLKKAPDDDPPYAIYNIGNQDPKNMIEMLDILEQELVNADLLPSDFDLQKHVELVPMQPGDVTATCADTAAFAREFGFRPATPLRTGLREFVKWYKQFYINRENS